MGGRLVYLSEKPLDTDEGFSALRDVSSVHEVAEFWGVSDETVRRILAKGALRFFKAGKRVLITKRAVLEYMGEGVS